MWGPPWRTSTIGGKPLYDVEVVTKLVAANGEFFVDFRRHADDVETAQRAAGEDRRAEAEAAQAQRAAKAAAAAEWLGIARRRRRMLAQPGTLRLQNTSRFEAESGRTPRAR